MADPEYITSTATVLMITISRGMILYVEDRISPAKKTALALAGLITTKYPSGTLDLVAYSHQLSIPIPTSMIAIDPHLQRFVRDFIFEDYIRNRRKSVR